MSKTPPNRRGITFEVGAQLEARDSLKNWYAANIEKIDYEDEKVLIHYRQWSHRYDEWFDWASPYLRPVERIQLRREGLHDDCPIPGFHVNDKVLASWSDCRFYPAKVISVNKDASYTVKFYDGVIQTVKGIHVKPFVKERKGGKPRSTERSKDKPPVRRVPGGRDRKPVENGSARNRKGRHSGSDQEGESNTEEDEEEEEERTQEDGPREAQPSQEEVIAKQEKNMRRKTSEEEAKEQPKRRIIERRKLTEKSQKKELGLEGTISSSEHGDDGEKRNYDEERDFGQNSVGQHTEEAGDAWIHREEVNGSGELEGGGEPRSRNEVKEEEEEEREHGIEEDKVTGQRQPQGRRTRNRPMTARWVDNVDRGILELRKRRISLGQNTPSKRSKLDTSADKDCPAESKPAIAEPQTKCSAEPVPDAAPVLPALTADTTDELGVVNQSEGPSSTGEAVTSAPPVKAPVRRQANNPNRFSREPLYRVVKNQPPPVLFINLDHNPFKCQVPGCLKSFRKAKLLHYHMKYYHNGDKAPDADLSPTRSVHTRASEKQGAATSPESPKRRRTISASMHSSLHSPNRVPQSPRADGKASSKPVERRRTSAPPAVHVQNLPRSLLREKSRENHLERTGRRPQERTALDMVLAKESEKQREKRRDFLRIKLKKKKKKKKKKSKSVYAGSEENIDISVFGLPPKLNLSHKLPPSHKHNFESHSRSPGQYSTELIRVDDDASGSDWSSDSLGWSEDETEVELDVTTPPQELGIRVGTGGSEIVRCVCEVEEENDFMVQCEDCLCWQHGACMGLLDDSLPGRYTCYICRDPPGQRQSQRYWYDRDWLSSGHMYGLPFLEENYSHQNAKKITATHQLLGDVHRVVEVLNGLQLKMSVLQSQSGPDLRLWCQPWKQAEKPSRKGVTVSTTPLEDNEDKSGLARGVPGTDTSPPVQQASYISSEHCYQKPRTYYPAVEQRLVVETRSLAGAVGTSDLEHSLRSTEDLLALERRYGGPLDPERGRTRGSPQIDLPSQAKESDSCRRQGESRGEVKVEEAGGGAGEGGGGACLHRQWQANLLDHIEAVQEEVTHRMDFIEKELDVLESWLDYTGELEPPEPLARLPQLKHRIKQLLSELAKVQQIAHCCAT